MHVFTATEFAGEPCETEEMRPSWFDLKQIPWEQMYPTDKMWLPWLIENRGSLNGFFKFSGGLEAKLVDYHLETK